MRFSELANFAVNDVTTTDILPTTDISANIDKKITMQNLFSWIATKAKTTFNGASQTIQAAINACVPNTRTVNGKALSSDITLSASDVSAVPTTRTVNNKALSSNITLSASDVGLSAAVPFKKGNSIAISGAVPLIGYITNANKQIMMTIPLPKSVDDEVTGCTVTVNGITVRGVNGYVDNNAAVSDYTITSSVLKAMGCVTLSFVKNSGTLANGTNNTPVGVLCSCTITFT